MINKQFTDKKKFNAKMTNSDTNAKRCQVRCFLIGSSAVGKSTLFKKLIKNNVDGEYLMTNRIAIEKRSYVQANNNTQQHIEAVLIDTPGIGGIYHKLVEDVFNNIVAIDPKSIVFVAMFDVTNRTSFDQLDTFILNNNKPNFNNNNIIKFTEQSNSAAGILLANKIDLTDKRVVSASEGLNKAKMFKLRYLECSALNDITMQEFDQLLFDLVLTNNNNNNTNNNNNNNNNLSLVTAVADISEN